MSRTALFVIDIQHALVGNPDTAIPHAQRIIDAGTALLERARSSIDSVQVSGKKPELDIVIVQHEETPEKGNLQKGSKAWEVHFSPRESDDHERLVAKDVRDTFQSNPEMADELRSRGVDTIVAFGIQSECCVLSTCRGALAEGFKVVLLKGAHSTYNTDEKTAQEIEKNVDDVLVAEGVEVKDWETWML